MDGILSVRNTSTVLLACVFAAAGCTNSGNKTADAPSLWSSQSVNLDSRQVADIQFGLGRTLERQGQLDKALAVYRQVIELDPKRDDAVRRLAIVFDQQGRFDESEKLFRRALKLRPGNPDVFCDMGYSLSVQKRWDEAIVHFKQCLELSPDHKRAHNNLGLVFGHMGRDEEALAEFTAGGCTVSEAHMNLAFLQIQNQRPAEAMRQYALAVSAGPSTPAVQTKLQALEDLFVQLEIPPVLSKNSPPPGPIVQMTYIQGMSLAEPQVAPSPATAPRQTSRPATVQTSSVLQTIKVDTPCGNYAFDAPKRFGCSPQTDHTEDDESASAMPVIRAGLHTETISSKRDAASEEQSPQIVSCSFQEGTESTRSDDVSSGDNVRPDESINRTRPAARNLSQQDESVKDGPRRLKALRVSLNELTPSSKRMLGVWIPVACEDESPGRSDTVDSDGWRPF